MDKILYFFSLWYPLNIICNYSNFYYSVFLAPSWNIDNAFVLAALNPTETFTSSFSSIFPLLLTTRLSPGPTEVLYSISCHSKGWWTAAINWLWVNHSNRVFSPIESTCNMSHWLLISYKSRNNAIPNNFVINLQTNYQNLSLFFLFSGAQSFLVAPELEHTKNMDWSAPQHLNFA